MLMIEIDKQKNQPLIRQLYAQLRNYILDGTLRSATRLPSSRNLAADLEVSRNTIMEVYDWLLAEGYLVTRPGAGTYVAEGAAFKPVKIPDISGIRLMGFAPYRTDLIDFRSGLPDLSCFPIKTWQRLSRETWDRVTPLDLAYSQPAGRVELREAVANYCSYHRGVHCHPEQIIITAGTTQAIGIVAKLLLKNSARTCILEDPITCDIRHIISRFGWKIVPAPVDCEGMILSKLPSQCRPAFIYVTPSHQFPLGVTMTIQRRVGLLEYTQRVGAYLIEDDYDSEFRYDSPPISSIQGLDPERVIYIGTFSKTLCPSMRIGYLIFPLNLVNQGRQAKWFTDLHNASVDQLILARFIRDGYFARYINRMKKNHAQRRRVLVESIERNFGNIATIIGSSAGLHLCLRFRGISFTEETLQRIEAAGVKVYPVEDHAIIRGRYTDTIILGFGILPEKRMEEGIRILKSCLDT